MIYLNIQMTTVKPLCQLKIDETSTEEHGTKSLYKSERDWILLAGFPFQSCIKRVDNNEYNLFKSLE